jgi:hypothetical protein
MKTPIAVMSFNRPDFLAETLQSLQNQADGAVEGHDLHLFQDGAINRWSKMRYAAQADIDRCMDIFKAAFPAGTIHYTGDNIGICENFCRAEEFFFRTKEYETAWFFEDDMVLSPVYFRMMERLQNFAERTPRVAYFSAYGNHYAGPAEVAANRREVITLDHHWAFGLRRDPWLKLQTVLSGYYELVRGQDYARRYHRGIFAYFEKSGLVPRGSSQDAAKTWACARLGLLRLRTFAPFARYIGTQGAHMTPEKFAELGFAGTIMEQQEIPDLQFPNDDAMQDMLDEQRNVLLEVYRKEYVQIFRGLPVRKYNPMREATAEDVIGAYRLLLNRNPESQAVIDGHAGKTAVFTLIRGLLRSREYQDGLKGKVPPARGGLAPTRICSDEELVLAYNLILHRDPDPRAPARGERNVTAALAELRASKEFSEIDQIVQHPW